MLAEISFDLGAWAEFLERMLARMYGYYQTAPVFFWAGVGLLAWFMLMWAIRGRKSS
jgi:hypothetical protein